MKNQYLTFFIGIMILFSVSPSWAQYGTGGGRVQESNLQYLIGKLDIYLQSEEGKSTFPEIEEYDRLHPKESFHALTQTVRPVVRIGEVKDSFDDDRDCVSHFGDPKNRYFECNQNALPAYKLENMASLYRIVLHELFLQAGIEKPISRSVPSDYLVSWRITQNVHLETYQEWVPGKAKKKCTVFFETSHADLKYHYHGWVETKVRSDANFVVTELRESHPNTERTHRAWDKKFVAQGISSGKLYYHLGPGTVESDYLALLDSSGNEIDRVLNYKVFSPAGKTYQTTFQNGIFPDQTLKLLRRHSCE